MIEKMRHRFDDWEEEIEQLRKKYRKIEKLI
jgi:hypothetical protein